MKRNYTPGPWWSSKCGEILKMPEQIKISNGISGNTYAEAKANARLIATAPELLEALESFVLSCKHQSGLEKGELSWNVQVAEKIIKKATETE